MKRTILTICLVYVLGLCNISFAQESIDEYRSVAEAGDVFAQYHMGLCYANGQCGVVEDAQEALKWYSQAAAQGDADAMNNIGVLYFNGKLGESDWLEAEKWFLKALSIEGNPIALNNISRLYVKQEYVIAKFNSELLEKYGTKGDDLIALREKAEKDAEAMFQLGVVYQFGLNGTTPDISEAVKWYENAAKKKNPLAQNALGNLYYTGNGVIKDIKVAGQWYDKANGKCGYARYALGNLIYFGEIKRRMSAIVARLEWQRASNKGYNLPQALYAAANDYITDTEAIKWQLGHHYALKYFRKAAEMGNLPAAYRLQVLEADRQVNPGKYKGFDFSALAGSVISVANQVSQLNGGSTNASAASGGGTLSGGGNGSNSGGGSCNCANIQTLYTRAMQQTGSTADTYAYARVGEIVDDTKLSSSALKGAAGQAMRSNAREAERLKREASKCGCSVQ